MSIFTKRHYEFLSGAIGRSVQPYIDVHNFAAELKAENPEGFDSALFLENAFKASIGRPIATRVHKAAPGACSLCDQLRAKGEKHHPSHDASSRCQSGGHSHCSCDTCF
jgi:hypothetical protein